MCLPYEGASPGSLPALMQTEPGSEAYSRERQVMAKSCGRQNSKKKRDKRRLLKRQATVSSWQPLDVSGWFDISADPEAESMDVFYPKASGLPSRVYKDFVPGEYYFNYYAHQHPDQEDELAAVSLVMQYVDSLLAEEVHEAEDTARPKKAVLKDLEKLSQNGSVIASTYLGYLYSTGTGVRSNPDRAETYLRFAVSKNDPLAFFWLAFTLEGEEAVQFMDKACEAGCPPAVSFRINEICAGSRNATSSEQDMLAGYLASFALNGSMRSLQELLMFLDTDCGDELRAKYGRVMLGILEGLVAENYVPALEYKAEFCLRHAQDHEHIEEVKQLYLKAYAAGSDTAHVKYASCLLHETEHGDLSWEAKKENVRVARKVLEEEYAKGLFLPVLDGMLGCVLVMSDDDADFRKGIQHLEKDVSANYLGMPLRAVTNIIMWSDKPERHKLAIKLLNAMVRKKNAEAIYLRGRYYLNAGLCENVNKDKGLSMVQEAALKGLAEAYFFIAEILVFGLYNETADMELAANMAKIGSQKNNHCNILYSLIQLGEFPGCTARPDEDEQHELIGVLMENATEDDYYLSVAFALVTLGADSPLTDYVLDSGVQDEEHSEAEIRSVVKDIAVKCDDCMQYCNLGPVSYTAYALRKIGKTSHAELTAGIFAQKLHLEQGSSCDDIADFLQEFVRSVPESYVQYRLAYSNNDTDEGRPLY